MRGKRAKIFRRAATVRGIHNRELYRSLKREYLRPDSVGRKPKMPGGLRFSARKNR